MATVFLARDPSIDRQVAIKVLPPQFTHDPQFLARFRREAKVIAALEHAYIVPVYDYGEQEGQPFLVMRYMAGGALSERMKGQPLSPAAVAHIVLRLAEALDEAHSHGIIHRDLKPSNVMFDARGQAFLSDFGIAKMVESSTLASLTGSSVVGTPAYMSPEQAVGDRGVDGRSDVYSLGVMVYEMLTGHHPYQADTPVRLLLKHVTEPVPQLDLGELSRLGLPEGMNTVLARALAKKPDERFGSAAEMTGSLVDVLGATRAPALDFRLTPTTPALTPPQPVRPPTAAPTLADPPAPATGAPTQAAPATGPASGAGTTGAGRPARPWLGQLLVGGGGLAGIAILLALGAWLGQMFGGTATATPTVTATMTIVAGPSRTAPPPSATQPPAATATHLATASSTPALREQGHGAPAATLTVTTPATSTSPATRSATPTRRPTRPAALNPSLTPTGEAPTEAPPQEAEPQPEPPTEAPPTETPPTDVAPTETPTEAPTSPPLETVIPTPGP
ncbi:MAG: protein kinase [Anaerolineales bacterium]|nr:protein kinase [Anaerolineales bacterium]